MRLHNRVYLIYVQWKALKGWSKEIKSHGSNNNKTKPNDNALSKWKICKRIFLITKRRSSKQIMTNESRCIEWKINRREKSLSFEESKRTNLKSTLLILRLFPFELKLRLKTRFEIECKLSGVYWENVQKSEKKTIDFINASRWYRSIVEITMQKLGIWK